MIAFDFSRGCGQGHRQRMGNDTYWVERGEFSSNVYFAAAIKLLTCIESIILVTVTIRQGYGELKRKLFAICLSLIAVQAFAEFHLVVAETFDLFLIWKRLDVFVYLAVAVMFHFALSYADIIWAKRWRFIVPLYAVFVTMAALTAVFALPVSGIKSPWGYQSIRSPLGQVVFECTLFVSILFSVGTFVVFLWLYRRSTDYRSKRQTRILLVAMGGLIFSGMVIETANPIFGFSVPYAFSSTTAFLFVNPFLGYALLRYQVLSINPAAAANDILHMMADGVLLLDLNGRIRYGNQVAALLLNRTFDNLVGKTIDELPLHRVSSGGAVQLHVPFSIGDSCIDEEAIIEGAGHTVVPVSLAMAPLIRKDKTRGFIVTLRDISIRKQAEERRNAVDKIMRHDLRNSLSTVMGFAEILTLDHTLGKRQHDWVKTIYKSGEMMVRQIESYLAIDRMEAGTFEWDPLTENLLDVINDAVFSLSRLIEQSHVKVKVTLDGRKVGSGDNLTMISQGPLLFSLFTNLIKNAIEASKKGNIVEVLIFSGKNIVVEVQNKGVIPETIKEHFFEKFVTYGKADGTGLGTYSAKLISKTLGGKISLETDAEAAVVKVVVSLPTIPKHMLAIQEDTIA